MNWVWKNTGDTATPFDWVIQDAPDALLRFLVPPIETSGAQDFWLSNILLTRYARDYAGSKALIDGVNGRNVLLADAEKERDIYIPVGMVKPELARLFDRSGNVDHLPGDTTLPVLATASDSIVLAQVVTADSGAFEGLGLDVGAVWEPELLNRARAASAAARPAGEPDRKVAYFSTPLANSGGGGSGGTDFGDYSFYIPTGGEDSDILFPGVPIDNHAIGADTVKSKYGLTAWHVAAGVALILLLKVMR